jgi:hypothetical protein
MCCSLNLLAVVPPSSLAAVTDPAARLGPRSDRDTPPEAVPAVGDLPLSAVCALLFGEGSAPEGRQLDAAVSPRARRRRVA